MSSTTTQHDENNDDIQGRFLMLPYDWRLPSWSKIRRRLWQPGGPLFVPKLVGWGWALNLAHPASWLIWIGLFAAACVIAL